MLYFGRLSRPSSGFKTGPAFSKPDQVILEGGHCGREYVVTWHEFIMHHGLLGQAGCICFGGYSVGFIGVRFANLTRGGSSGDWDRIL